jgi:hypothetical protein
MDETGFRIRVTVGRVIITHLSTKAVYLTNPNNRESITVVEIVCADCSTIPPMLTLKGDALLERHFENGLETEILLTTNPTGYSNEDLGMKYLIHFYNNIYKKTKGKWRILIFDSYGSRISEPFLVYC